MPHCAADDDCRFSYYNRCNTRHMWRAAKNLYDSSGKQISGWDGGLKHVRLNVSLSLRRLSLDVHSHASSTELPTYTAVEDEAELDCSSLVTSELISDSADHNAAMEYRFGSAAPQPCGAFDIVNLVGAEKAAAITLLSNTGFGEKKSDGQRQDPEGEWQRSTPEHTRVAHPRENILHMLGRPGH